MIELGPASEDEMIAAFLRAEIDSSRYGNNHVKAGLGRFGLDRRVIDAPNLADVDENEVRKRLMEYRGYQARELLFSGFPLDAIWRRVELDVHDFETMRYINDARTSTPCWTSLSGGTRLVSLGARNFRENPATAGISQISDIAEALRKGMRFSELIAAETRSGSLVLIEGHSRATAYVLEQFAHVEALVATSPSMDRWYFY
jgi:hypothetical protein